jgi:uncharacterized protein YlzI (FlbEa/FlbD family)
MFLKLTGDDGVEFLLNTNQIRTIRPKPQKVTKTFISDMDGKGEWFVMEDIKEIKRQLSGGHVQFNQPSKVVYEFQIKVPEDLSAGLYGSTETVSISTSAGNMEEEQIQFIQDCLKEYYEGEVTWTGRRIVRE